jgi:hypothetical protein
MTEFHELSREEFLRYSRDANSKTFPKFVANDVVGFGAKLRMPLPTPRIDSEGLRVVRLLVRSLYGSTIKRAVCICS